MTESKVRKVLPFRQVLLILMSFVFLYLGVGFVQQAGVSRQQREELGRIEQEIAVAQEESANLEKRLDYVQSSAAAEEWARENGWAKPDEVSVVVVAPSAQPVSAGEQDVESRTGPSSNREAWWELFFSSR